MAPHGSRKRKRSWLEIGFAGCSSMLAIPFVGAWPEFGPRLTPHTNLRDHHHGTPVWTFEAAEAAEAAVEPAAVTSAAAAELAPSAIAAPASTKRRQRLRRLRRGLAGKEIEITLHAAIGDWGACSPETCTQTRPVFCETRDARIVASHLCGEELPAAERACGGADAAAVCGGGGAAAATADASTADEAAAAEGGREGGSSAAAAAMSGAVDQGNRGGAFQASGSRPEARRSGPTPASFGRSNGSGTGTTADAAVAVGGGERTGTMSSPAPPSAVETLRGAGQHAGTDVNTTAMVKNATTQSPATTRQGLKVSASKTKKSGYDHGPPATAAAAAAVEDGQQRGSEAYGRGREAEQPGGTTVRHKEDAFPSNHSSAFAPRSSQPKLTASEPSRQQPLQQLEHQPQQQLSQVGGTGLGSSSSRLEYRFWVVLAIGAGAVGSFIGAAVLALRQYRKEQHRLRGIMALNELPLDNYVNPFAKQPWSDMSDDDRAAFKL